MSPAAEQRLAGLRAGLKFAGKARRPALEAMIAALLAEEAAAEQPIPERATAVDPEPKPPEAPKQAEDGAGSSSEADPAERGGGPATSRPRMPGDTSKPGRAGEAGGSPAPSTGGGMAEPPVFPAQARSLADIQAPPASNPCGWCNKTLERHPGEPDHTFHKRRYCDTTCRGKAERARAARAMQAGRERARAKLRGAPVGRQAEEDAIARFIAEHGVTTARPAYCAPSPQGARDEGEAALLVARFEAQQQANTDEVVKYLKNCGRAAWWNGRVYKLDGRLCTRGDLYRAANELRRAAGLLPYRLPSAAAVFA